MQSFSIDLTDPHVKNAFDALTEALNKQLKREVKIMGVNLVDLQEADIHINKTHAIREEAAHIKYAEFRSLACCTNADGTYTCHPWPCLR